MIFDGRLCFLLRSAPFESALQKSTTDEISEKEEKFFEKQEGAHSQEVEDGAERRGGKYISVHQ